MADRDKTRKAINKSRGNHKQILQKIYEQLRNQVSNVWE